ncbi:SPX-domain-containing protein [Tilletiaria anomala UBC 951]|uniref:SPX-domain-containing protein n=1 Tax=Tilletiaria anomala (strain ATCC 24038 / CBS 436.72 / UBC 951) TaxID=1037660 RepID=A0A066WK75_TILAU|nr:SPX-domain-containing protein [Tilletiaria anomala UBC 951]KDN52968.1 SPX-domain-containing protein [Tilletiaria anomala UBC 951]
MKFSHSLQFNSVPDWADKYIAYSNLKKSIYNLEKDAVDGQTPAGGLGTYRDLRDDIENESAALLSGEQRSDTDPIFLPLLDKELRKIVQFYESKEKQIYADVARIEEDLERAENEEMVLESEYDLSDDDDADDDVDPSAAIVQGGMMQKGSRWRRTSLDAVVKDPAQYNEASRWQRQIHNSDSEPRQSVTRRGGVEGGDVLGEGLSTGTLSRRRSNSASSWQPNPRWNFFRPRPARKHSVGLFGGGDQQQSSSRLRSDSETTSSALGEAKSINIWTADNDYAIDVRITFKRRITEIFVALSELQQFVTLNQTGMKKILKKYDKITSSSLKDRYLEDVVGQQYPFRRATQAQQTNKINRIVACYAKVVTGGDAALALQQLKTHLREQVVWQRNTVWREMIGIERRAQGATLERSVMGAGKMGPGGKPERPTKLCGVTLPSWLGLPTLQLVGAFAALVLLLKAPSLRLFGRIEEQNCLALLVFCTILWATEVIPLFVTSFMVPLLVVTLQVARTDDIEDRRMTASETAKWIFLQMFAPNMCLLLGGFTLAAALSKYGIDKILAIKVLRMAGTRPSMVLLAHMAVACFASMWISNVAAPVLMYSLIQPILRTLPPKSTYASALIMGIALASNIGGQTSPIASPQNLIALQYMDESVGWLQWFAITIPVSGCSLLVIWVVLLWVYGSGRGVSIRRISESNDSFSGLQYFISGVTVATILLWCFEKKLERVLGDMGVAAIIPIIMFFGTGILSKEDFNNFLHTVLFLAMGGIALGKAVTSSGLLESLDEVIQGLVKNLPLWQVLASLLVVSLVIATFISHTIAAVLLVPIAAQVGDSLSTPHPRLLIMATTLAASAAMGLPVSGFPNMTASSQEDSVGERYLTVKDFIKSGVLASVLCTAIIGTIGVVIMLALGL